MSEQERIMISQPARKILDKMLAYKVFRETEKGFDFTEEFRDFADKFVETKKHEWQPILRKDSGFIEVWMMIIDDFGIKDISDQRNIAKVLKARKKIIDEQRRKLI